MRARLANLALLVVVFVTSVSGCASLSLQPNSNAKLPVSSNGATSANSNSLDIQFGIARLLERNGKLEEARRAYLEILSLDSHTPSLHRLGVTAIRQNRLDAGLKHLSDAVAAGNPTAELLGDFGYAQLLVGDLPAAESTLRSAVGLDPSQKRNVNNLAIAVGKQNRLRESFQLFRQTSQEAEALANLAFLQAQVEDLDKAKANYNHALELDPELEIAAIGLVEVHNHIESYNRIDSSSEQYSNAQFASESPVQLRNQPKTQAKTQPGTVPAEPIHHYPPIQQRIVSVPPQPAQFTREPQPNRIASQPVHVAPEPQPTRITAAPQPTRIAASQPTRTTPVPQAALVTVAPQPTRIKATPQPTRIVSLPPNSTDRLLAAIKRPVELPGRAPAGTKSSRKTRSSQTAKLGPGTFQPPSFDQHSDGTSGVILQASYEEPISQPPPTH